MLPEVFRLHNRPLTHVEHEVATTSCHALGETTDEGRRGCTQSDSPVPSVGPSSDTSRARPYEQTQTILETNVGTTVALRGGQQRGANMTRIDISNSFADRMTDAAAWLEDNVITYGVALPICMLAVLF